jgi:hypothetical protein
LAVAAQVLHLQPEQAELILFFLQLLHLVVAVAVAFLAALTLVQQLADQAVVELHLQADQLKEQERLVIQAAILR